ncbi:MAG: phosphoribosyltransferase [Chitinophagaceae bacterium]|nr:MAG: phosphoribosyltransferase [Chitinophagaceae bacterium]
MSASKNYILDQQVAARKIRRMALEIIENNEGESEIVLAGVDENGSVIARIIEGLIHELSSIRTSLITISMDKRVPGEIRLSEDPGFDNKVVIIVDDVANSGKTLLYALKPFLAYHPKKIQTLILVERSHNSFPVRPDYTGLSIASTLQEHIYVEVEGSTVIGAYLS